MTNNNLPPSSPKLLANSDPDIPSPYEERSFRLRPRDSPPRIRNRTPPSRASRTQNSSNAPTPHTTPSTPGRSRSTPTSPLLSAMTNNNLPPTSPKLNAKLDPDAPSPYEERSFRLRAMDSPPRSTLRTPPRTIATVPRLQVSPYRNNSFRLKRVSHIDATTQSAGDTSIERPKRAFSRRSLFSEQEEPISERKVEIPFFDPNIAGSTREDRAKVESSFAKFEAIFAGTNRNNSPPPQQPNQQVTSMLSNISPSENRSKRKVKPKVKVAFETTPHKSSHITVVATVTGKMKTTSIAIRPPRPPVATVNRTALVSQQQRQQQQQQQQQQHQLSNDGVSDTADEYLFFKTGVMRYELLDAAENLVEKKNTMTVTGRTAIKRVFPETKNGLKIEVNGANVALYRVEDTVYAVGTECPHRKGPLHLGDIEDVEKHGMCVVCPWHRWTFRLSDGLLVKPDRGDVSSVVYPVQVDPVTNEISVGFTSFGNNLFGSEVDF
jgi:nitrite reductase/ring-hydroxylating ferredoxin subunit